MSIYSSTLSRKFEQLRRDNTLIHLDIVKSRGQFFKLAARVISVNTENNTMLLYDVDGKKVENIHFSEIDDYTHDAAPPQPPADLIEINLEKS
ncbi:hypothetical protein [Cohnella soli]|uniref:Uncharacterized protein n=1 Tax=Cohnella soli TaxID=425005 RepID=A0ABW0HMB4_9BACL